MKTFLVLTVFGIGAAFYVVSNAFLGTAAIKEIVENTESIEVTGCSTNPERSESFRSSKYAEIRKLGELDEKCKSQTSTELMIFTNFPKDTNVAKKMASDMSERLKAYHDAGITPLVIVEPDSDWGLVDFKEFNTGFYDNWISAYFKELKALGITDDMMGTWVPFPEANLPYWNHQNTSPSDFAKGVNRYVALLKKEFPNAKASILLNSATYPTDDYNWAEGEYISLEPYVSGITPGLLDSFGMQGLPWMPPANEKGTPIFDPKEFLQVKLAKEAADILKVKKIWINTGSFAAKYTQEPEKKVIVPAPIRKQMLMGILDEASSLKKDGYSVSVNFFAEDKSSSVESTDWSYWGSEYTMKKDHEIILVDYLKEARKNDLSTSFYLR